MREFDHFIYGGRELEPMRRSFASLAGVEAAPGGRHPGLGTHNALTSLGDGVYLELLAVDPEQPRGGDMSARLQTFSTPHLFAYMFKGSDLEAAQKVLERHGIDSDLFDASRRRPDGAVLRWRLLVPRDNSLGDFVPKFIDWMDTPHPSRTTAPGCRFESFSMGHPQSGELDGLLRELGAEMTVQHADRPYMHLKIETPRGPLVLSSAG
jgi:hypothetical protein